MNLTHEQVKRLEDKDVMKYYKRYETYIGANTTKTLIGNCLSFFTKALGYLVRLEDIEALRNELKSDFIIMKELSNFSGEITLRYGCLLAVVEAFLITANHVDFSARHPSRDSDGYPLAGQDEVPTPQQSSVNDE